MYDRHCWEIAGGNPYLIVWGKPLFNCLVWGSLSLPLYVQYHPGRGENTDIFSLEAILNRYTLSNFCFAIQPCAYAIQPYIQAGPIPVDLLCEAGVHDRTGRVAVDHARVVVERVLVPRLLCTHLGGAGRTQMTIL